MEEIKIYIEEVKRRVDGSIDLEAYSYPEIIELSHDWFTLPVTREEILERVGLDIDTEEYCIKSYDTVGVFIPRRYQTVEQFNNLYERLQELEGTPFYNHIAELQMRFIGDLDILLENLEYIRFYPGYGDLKELARDKGMDEQGMEDIDYLVVSDGIFEYDV